MIISDGASRSTWQASGTSSRMTEPLREDVETDVCIAGAGIVGLTVAWQLIKAGKRVVVIDSAAAGAGQTGRSTAHVATALDNRYAAMERLHGTASMRLVAESLMAAVGELERIVGEADLDCGFSKVDGYLIQAEGQGDPDVPGAELEAALRAGVAGVEVVDALPGAVGRPHGGLALRFPDQASFDPFKYNIGLMERVMDKGGRIFSMTGMEDLEELEGQGGWEVRTSGGHRIRAKSVVVATNAPVHHRFTMHTKQAAYRSYVVAFDLPADAYERILLWDTADPYHYVRMAPGESPGRDFLIVGGEDHRTGQANDAEERYAALERWTRANFPKAGGVVHKWSGQVLEPADGLAFIGRDPTAEQVYLVTGDSGQGTSHAMIAGRLITDLILGISNPWEEVYSPARKITGLQGIREFVSDQANVAAQYTDLVKGSEIEDEEQLPRGDGAVIRRGLTREAVHRDQNGILHRHSAICPHLGCVVQWNREEQTWDCPCHGSRFQADGKAVEGPAISGLEEK